MKPVRLSRHAQEQLPYRGTTQQEIEEAIRSAQWSPGELGRSECRKDFAFAEEWNGRMYTIKQVRRIFVEEADEIVVVTVYTYYF